MAGGGRGDDADLAMAAEIRDALDLYGQLRDEGGVEIRLHRAVLYNSIFRADDQLLVSQHAYGIPAARAPSLHLCRTDGGDMTTSYRESFERVWACSVPLE